MLRELPSILDNLLILNQLPHPRSAGWQMACDEWLLNHSFQPVLRVYAWSEPVWSFGYFQRLETVRAELGGLDGPLMRRWTGGGMVDHRADLPYSLIVPTQYPWLATEQSYHAVHRALAEALRRQGLEAELQAGECSVGHQCFRNPVPADVMLEGRKVAGAAQRRSRRGTLHQGSVQIPSGQVDGHVLLVDLAAALARTAEFCELSVDDLAGIARLAEEKYASQQWLHLR